MARRPVVRIPFPPTTGDLAVAFRRQNQSIRKNSELKRLSTIGELLYEPESVEKFAEKRGMTVIWIDPRTEEPCDPFAGVA